MQTLTCGYRINRSMHGVTLPSILRLWTLRQSLPWMGGVTPPSSLRNLICGYRLNQSLHGDDAVQPAVGELWPQAQTELAWRHARATMPSSLQTLTCG